MNSNHFFSALLVSCACLIIWRLIPPSVDANFTLSLSKSRDNIEKINQPRNVSDTRQLNIDRIELNLDNHFKHATLGALGWAEHFYADIESRFRVSEPGRFRFLVGSDDGFRLSIDGRLLCQYPTDRPYRKQSCYQTLSAGEHTLELSYFQGYGNAGLTLEASKDGDSKARFWGDKIEGIEYIQPQ